MAQLCATEVEAAMGGLSGLSFIRERGNESPAHDQRRLLRRIVQAPGEETRSLA
jgi:hypothetical protein